MAIVFRDRNFAVAGKAKEKVSKLVDWAKNKPTQSIPMIMSASSLGLMAHNTYMSAKDRAHNMRYRQAQIDTTNALTGQLMNTTNSFEKATRSINNVSRSMEGVGRSMGEVSQGLGEIGRNLQNTNGRLDMITKNKIVPRKTRNRNKNKKENEEKKNTGFLGRVKRLFS